MNFAFCWYLYNSFSYSAYSRNLSKHNYFKKCSHDLTPPSPKKHNFNYKTIHTQLIQTFPDGSQLSFDDGSFDSWCVYLKKPNQAKYAPTDVEYFTRLKQLGTVHGHEKIYSDFITFYTPTSKNIDAQVLNLISRIAASYHNDSLEMEILFAIIYAGMIAEENKQFAILKKRVKRLGMHQTLIDKISPAEAANFSKGKKWKELDEICKAKGF